MDRGVQEAERESLIGEPCSAILAIPWDMNDETDDGKRQKT
jgi:hypothetical protein